jgi:hypothetical protein
MFEAATPLQIAALLAAVGWPFAAGLGLVLWSKTRAAERARREAAVEGELKGLYRTVAGRPVPERLALVVEALEEAEAMAPRPVDAPAKAPQPAG